MKRAIRRLATVPRWTIIPTIQRQSVAEHSYFVAVYAKWIAELFSYPGPHGPLLAGALFHDKSEIVTGDLPTPAKDWCPMGALDDRASQMTGARDVDCGPLAEWIIKLADLYEALMFLAEEESLGNQNVAGVKIGIRRKMLDHFHRSPFDGNRTAEVKKLLVKNTDDLEELELV